MNEYKPFKNILGNQFKIYESFMNNPIKDVIERNENFKNLVLNPPLKNVLEITERNRQIAEQISNHPLKDILEKNNELARQIIAIDESMIRIKTQIKSVLSENQITVYSDMLSSINILNAPIDWSPIREDLPIHHKDIFDFANRLFEEEIYLDFTYFNDISQSASEEFLNKDRVIEWMEENVQEIVGNMLEKPYLNRHKKLLSQSIKSYIEGNLESAIIVILPTIEFFVSNWLKSQDKNGYFDADNPTTKPWKKEKLKKLSGSSIELFEDDELVQYFFECKALEGVHKIFCYTPDIKISRNSILHGSYDYNKLERLDYLKLVYLLNSLLPLYEVVLKVEHK